MQRHRAVLQLLVEINAAIPMKINDSIRNSAARMHFRQGRRFQYPPALVVLAVLLMR